jgi:2'-5' RNA ligase
MRMFVAIDLDESTKAAVAREQQMAWRLAAQSPIKFVNPQQAHLTLAFLADVPAPQVDRVIAAMAEPIAEPGPFQMAFGGLGVFPPKGAPRVLWLGVLGGARESIVLQREVTRRLQALGLTLDDRDFHPHLTIGRWKQGRPSDRPAPGVEARSTGAMTVDHVTLYESRLSSEGPTHIERTRAALTAS